MLQIRDRLSYNQWGGFQWFFMPWDTLHLRFTKLNLLVCLGQIFGRIPIQIILLDLLIVSHFASKYLWNWGWIPTLKSVSWRMTVYCKRSRANLDALWNTRVCTKFSPSECTALSKSCHILHIIRHIMYGLNHKNLQNEITFCYVQRKTSLHMCTANIARGYVLS